MPEELKVIIRIEDGAFWATVEEFPGLFASGDTLEELRESLEEGVALYVSEEGREVSQVRLAPLEAPTEPIATSAHLAYSC